MSFKKIICTFLLSFLCISYVGMPSVYATETMPREPIGDPVPTNQYRFINKTSISNKYGSYKTVVSHNSPVSSTTNIEGSISYGVSNTLSFSSSFSSSVTNSAITSGVGSSLGISLNKNVNKTASAVLELKKGQSGRIDARPVYNAYKGIVQRKYITDTGGTIWLKYKDGYIKEFSHFDFKTYTK